MSDPAVKIVQQWVNNTYRNRTGYGEEIEENGRTGWSTVYALTRALQIELGIANPVNNFGPTTESRYIAWGEMEEGSVPTDEKGQRIVRILQGACYCKGYDPGGFNGFFGPKTKAAVQQLQTDAGLPNRDGKVYAYIFKAFLTMDAYRLTRNGSQTIRTIQQELNNKYYKTAGVQPCDGHYQRQTNKSRINPRILDISSLIL
ncbi:peptidoglycan-binding domain-containing protein [Shouchella clausii]|uniref:peptidoglycan-binding domain-containing protein n=1 Tax=Shouchella clausii TaxID=79880 RepID=UPI00211CDA3D|nr:peptidoglycan-binding domain-containing protein [Shouchella clausii]MCR1289469.1 peptidoglycan-binding protein [Shouchella clausii]MEB5473716.1 peptidoglycan-binding domain-containing protein [Shouchella clausii]MEB5479282.1 peptidoglycan-binding domain-containing protein [Shouchella clausii]WQG94699.1 peptidoglycan-binding domain-containing protein [Shouchella clausii]